MVTNESTTTTQKKTRKPKREPKLIEIQFSCPERVANRLGRMMLQGYDMDATIASWVKSGLDEHESEEE